jgi:hypothetical protein
MRAATPQHSPIRLHSIQLNEAHGKLKVNNVCVCVWSHCAQSIKSLICRPLRNVDIKFQAFWTLAWDGVRGQLHALAAFLTESTGQEAAAQEPDWMWWHGSEVIVPAGKRELHSNCLRLLAEYAIIYPPYVEAGWSSVNLRNHLLLESRSLSSSF